MAGHFPAAGSGAAPGSHQRDFRIKPFRAMMGALRVKPEVLLEVSAPVPPEKP